MPFSVALTVKVLFWKGATWPLLVSTATVDWEAPIVTLLPVLDIVPAPEDGIEPLLVWLRLPTFAGLVTLDEPVISTLVLPDESFIIIELLDELILSKSSSLFKVVPPIFQPPISPVLPLNDPLKLPEAAEISPEKVPLPFIVNVVPFQDSLSFNENVPFDPK